MAHKPFERSAVHDTDCPITASHQPQRFEFDQRGVDRGAAERGHGAQIALRYGYPVVTITVVFKPSARIASISSMPFIRGIRKSVTRTL